MIHSAFLFLKSQKNIVLSFDLSGFENLTGVFPHSLLSVNFTNSSKFYCNCNQKPRSFPNHFCTRRISSISLQSNLP